MLPCLFFIHFCFITVRCLLSGVFIQAVTHGRFLFLDRRTFPSGLGEKQVGKSGIVAVYNKVNIPVISETVLILTDRDRLRPCLIVP